MAKIRRRGAAWLLWAALPGCYTGADLAEDSGTAGGSDSSADDPAAPDPFCAEGSSPGSISRMVRLTHRQYDNAVADLLGIDAAPSAGFLADPAVAGFDNNAEQLVVGDRLARDYRRAAETIAETLIADPPRLAALVPCSDTDDCARAFIEDFGLRAFRRPLTPAEQTALFDIYASAGDVYGTGSAFEQGIALVIEAALQSPRFLYRVELSVPEPGQDVVALDGYEVAARLSFLLWNSIPDAALLAAAADGTLDDAEGVEAQARRMLDDPRAADPVEDFHAQWLELGKVEAVTKDPDAYPNFDEDVAAAMRDETLAFVQAVALDEGGSFADLMTSTQTVANADLAEIYGLSGSFGASMEPVELDPTERAGLLTQPGFLAAHAYFAETSPIHRGVFVQRQILCTEIPDPPGDADLDLPPVSGELVTTRDRVEAHTSPGYCAGCHSLINEPGFAFEGYDAIGRIRTEDNGEPVDTQGVLRAGGEELPFSDAIDLAHQLADSPVAQRCYLTQWFRYASGRREQSGDACSLDGLDEALRGSNYEIRELLVALTQTASFRYRSTEAP